MWGRSLFAKAHLHLIQPTHVFIELTTFNSPMSKQINVIFLFDSQLVCILIKEQRAIVTNVAVWDPFSRKTQNYL